MGYVLKAVLSSAQHPEYGQITVPFPIPDEKYDRMIELLEPLEIGDALRQDCRVDELDSFYTVLNRLVGSLVNFDELDYLAKRLDSFDDGEAAQFQGMACKLGVSNIKDFINLTFCCQQATVITDFSDLDAIGRQHYMTMQGGGCRIEELERLDGRKFALDLILNHLEGRITPYGVVYDNGMKLEQLYDGRHFPCYHQPAASYLSQAPEDAALGPCGPVRALCGPVRLQHRPCGNGPADRPAHGTGRGCQGCLGLKTATAVGADQRAARNHGDLVPARCKERRRPVYRINREAEKNTRGGSGTGSG